MESFAHFGFLIKASMLSYHWSFRLVTSASGSSPPPGCIQVGRVCHGRQHDESEDARHGEEVGRRRGTSFSAGFGAFRSCEYDVRTMWRTMSETHHRHDLTPFWSKPGDPRRARSVVDWFRTHPHFRRRSGRSPS